jgi:rubrerythrin
MMKVNEALKVAIEYEHKVRDHYANGAAQILNPKGKKVFETLAKEEQGHVDYLESRLGEWTKRGRVENVPLGTLLPPREWAEAARERFAKGHEPTIVVQAELDLLKVALDLERQTSAFYRGMVNTLPTEDKALFERFLDIEEGHVAIVQAEIDAVAGMGTWFDLMEFSLEGG